MKASVIITTYNRPQFIKRVIDGHLNQTRQPDEIIIADDGSTEKTGFLVNEFKRRSKIAILHIWQEDRGFRASLIRNKAIAHSSGKYLIICDDDVIPDKRFVEDHLRYAEKGHFIQGHRVLLGKAFSEHFTCKNISFFNLLKLFTKNQANNIFNALRLPLPLITISQKLKGIRSCNMSFFREDFFAVNGFNEDFKGWGKEDSELVVRFFKYGLKRKDIKFRACCYHLYHPSYSRENLNKNIALLERTIKGKGYFCVNGIDKYL